MTATESKVFLPIIRDHTHAHTPGRNCACVCKQYVDSVFTDTAFFIRKTVYLRKDLTVAVVVVACCRRSLLTLAFNVGC